jgi:hypothetical protein
MLVGAGTVLLLAEGKKLDIGRGWYGFNDLFVYTYKAFSSVSALVCLLYYPGPGMGGMYHWKFKNIPLDYC